MWTAAAWPLQVSAAHVCWCIFVHILSASLCSRSSLDASLDFILLWLFCRFVGRINIYKDKEEPVARWVYFFLVYTYFLVLSVSQIMKCLWWCFWNKDSQGFCFILADHLGLRTCSLEEPRWRTHNIFMVVTCGFTLFNVSWIIEKNYKGVTVLIGQCFLSPQLLQCTLVWRPRWRLITSLNLRSAPL